MSGNDLIANHNVTETGNFNFWRSTAIAALVESVMKEM